jgi:hypothetical protein
VPRLAFAALAVAAIAVQVHHLSSGARFRPVNFFSFFTIDSNLLAIATLTLSALVARRPPSAVVEALRGAATLYLAITGVIFTLLLADIQEDLQLTLPWVDTVLHTILPAVLAVDWLVDPPRTRLHPRLIALWLAFPVVWATYTLVRGPLADWYPYPFIDPRVHGYGGVAAIAAVLFAGFSVASLLVWVLGRRTAGGSGRRIRSDG